ncbi:hypothetical protein B4U80_04496 [Leptotrombidium deliense]|uniref:Ribosomal protein/NADH dehydrogenase domain-containing protein n=1 Tax=Leptotrombidium deliense TaxID=299467 RepID=A0A443SL84_9ACAR|nr:hypothetical protein B4U80_04496 [Leptotrombidium deliense]
MDIFRKCAFLIGPGPIRRTLPYLKSGKLVFKDRVKVMEVHYNRMKRQDVDPLRQLPPNAHKGLVDFYFWYTPQIQYMNPNVQIVRFQELFPNPFIRCWLDDGRDVMFDCYMKPKEDILTQLVKILGKTKEKMAQELSIDWEKQNWTNKGIFGINRERYCMCEIPGQVPCPGVVDLPKAMQGKYKWYLKEELEKWEQDLDAPYDDEKTKVAYKRVYPHLKQPPVDRWEGLEKMEFRKTYPSSTKSGLIKDDFHYYVYDKKDKQE